MKVTIVNPTTPNTQDLVWNKQTGRYELSVECVKSNFENNFKDDGILQKRITKNSRVVYNQILSRTYSQNKSVVNFFLNRTEEGHRFLKDILLTQMESDMTFGTNDLGNTPLVNTTTGGHIDRNVVRENILTVNAENVLYDCESYFGFNLFVMTLLPITLFQFVRLHEND